MHTILSLLAFSLLFQATGQDKKTDRDYDELNGPVRIVRIEKQDLPDETGNPKNNQRELYKIVAYDKSGSTTEELSFMHTCILTRTRFSYDAQGNRTMAIYWGESVVTANQPSASQKSATPMIVKQAFTFDPSGRRSEVNEYDATGRLDFKSSYKYDDKGRNKEILVGDGYSLNSSCKFKYDDQGLVSEEICHNRFSDTGTAYTYEMDANGNWIKRTASETSAYRGGKEVKSRHITHITYREIKYYAASGDTNQPQEAVGTFDGTKLTPCPPMTIRKSGGVLQGSATKRVKPAYPPGVAAAGISGTVVVEVTVDETGKVIRTNIISGPAELRAVCENAAKGWEFKPTTLSRVPVKVIGTITFNFNL